MMLSLTAALTPVIALTLCVISQVIVVHLSKNLLRSLLAGLVSGLITSACVLLLDQGQLAWSTVTVIYLTYFALFFCFWAFLNLNITSLRIRVLRELLLGNHEMMTTHQLLARYSSEELFHRRIERMVAAGYLQKSNSDLVLVSNKLIYIERIIAFLRKLMFPRGNKT